MGLFSSEDSSDESTSDESDEKPLRGPHNGGFKQVDEFGGTHLERTIDKEAGVVLYTQQLGGASRDYGGKGLAAVPLKDTELTIEDENCEDEESG